jgi:hypothetical protein
MSFEEKFTWVNAVVTVIVAAVYCVLVFGQLGDVPAAEIAYQRPMIIAVVALIVLTIVGTILMAIGTAVSAEITGSGSVDDVGRKDERDVRIGHRGMRASYVASSVGGLLALGLAMLEYDYFWIANVLFLSFVVAGLVSSAVKLMAYRRGF